MYISGLWGMIIFAMMAIIIVLLSAVISYLKRNQRFIESGGPSFRPAMPPRPQPYIQPGVRPEVVAAIAAAVAEMDNGNYVIHSVTEAKPAHVPAAVKTRGRWGQAGVASAVEPF